MLDRLVALGVTNPAEATVKRLVGVVAACHCPDADAPQLHSLVSEVKSQAAMRKNTDTNLPHITTYPALPADLPEEVRASGYPEGAPPVQKDIPGLQQIVARIPLRNTHRSVRPMAPQGQPADLASLFSMLIQQYSARRGSPAPGVPLVMTPAVPRPALEAAASLPMVAGVSPLALPAPPVDGAEAGAPDSPESAPSPALQITPQAPPQKRACFSPVLQTAFGLAGVAASASTPEKSMPPSQALVAAASGTGSNDSGSAFQTPKPSLKKRAAPAADDLVARMEAIAAGSGLVGRMAPRGKVLRVESSTGEHRSRAHRKAERQTPPQKKNKKEREGHKEHRNTQER